MLLAMAGLAPSLPPLLVRRIAWQPYSPGAGSSQTRSWPVGRAGDAALAAGTCGRLAPISVSSSARTPPHRQIFPRATVSLPVENSLVAENRPARHHGRSGGKRY